VITLEICQPEGNKEAGFSSITWVLFWSLRPYINNSKKCDQKIPQKTGYHENQKN